MLVVFEDWKISIIVFIAEGYQSTHHAVIWSHGQLVTRVSAQSQLVTSEHITKPPVVIFLSPHQSGSTQKQCSTRTA